MERHEALYMQSLKFVIDARVELANANTGHTSAQEPVIRR